jgi:hypothetical protein
MTKTTFEMDGLFTEEDIANRHTVVFQCQGCNKWTPHKNWLPGEKNEYIPCTTCGEKMFDSSSIKSLRTYSPLTDNKRRIKKKK